MANAAADEMSVDTLDIADDLLVAVVAAAIIFATVALRFVDGGAVELNNATSGFAPDIFRRRKFYYFACRNSTPIYRMFFLLLSWKTEEKKTFTLVLFFAIYYLF